MKEKRGLIPILNVILVVIILMLILPVIFRICPFLEVSISVGSSMTPTLKTGDTMFIRNSVEDIQIGDIISFSGIVHRVIDIKRSPTLIFKTKGDANEKSDGWIKAEQVEGKIVYVVPTRFLFSSRGLIILIVLSILLMVVIRVYYHQIESLSLNLTTIMLLLIVITYSLGRLSGIHAFQG